MCILQHTMIGDEGGMAAGGKKFKFRIRGKKFKSGKKNRGKLHKERGKRP